VIYATGQFDAEKPLEVSFGLKTGKNLWKAAGLDSFLKKRLTRPIRFIHK